MGFAQAAPLIFAPLATYLYVVGLWHTGRSPRVLAGPIDFGLLAAGLAGLVVFGPLGQTWTHPILGPYDLGQSLRLLALYALIAVAWSARYRNRLVIYNVDASALEVTLGSFALARGLDRTWRGWGSPADRRGFRLERTGGGRAGLVELDGGWPPADRNQLIAAIRSLPREPDTRRVAWQFFGASCLTMLLPLATLLIVQPRARAALWHLLEPLTGG